MGSDHMSQMVLDWPEIIILGLIVLLLAVVAGIAAGHYGRRLRCDRQTAGVFERLDLFQPGDEVTCGGVRGTVDSIHRSGVRLTLSDLTTAFVPNAQLMAQVVINHAKGCTNRHALAFHVDHEDDIESAADIINEVLSKESRARVDYPAEITAPVPKEGTCCVRIAFWTAAQDGYSVRDTVSADIEKGFKLEGIRGWAIKGIIHPRPST